MKTSIANQEALRAATVRHIGPYPEIGKAFTRLDQAVREAGLGGPDAVLIALYHDNPQTTEAAVLRSDAGLLVNPGVKLPGTLSEAVIAGGRYLHGQHQGSYAGLPAAWAALRTAMQEQGLQRRTGPSYELYPNNPDNSAVADLITEIYIPID